MIKKLLKGDLDNIAQVPITEQDDVEIPDFPEGGITNAQMAAALTEELDGFYLLGSVYLCTDNGEHGIKSHLYEFTLDGWEDVTPQFILKGASDPTSTTVGEIGQFYLNISSSELFQCTAIVEEDDIYYYEWTLRKDKYIIELSGESGTLTDTQFAQVMDDSVVVEITLDGRIYHYIRDAVNYKEYSNTIYPTINTKSTKVITINTNEAEVDYKHWSVEEQEVMENPMTTAGDIIVGGTNGVPSRLGIGTAGQVLKVNSAGTALEYGDISSSVDWKYHYHFEVTPTSEDKYIVLSGFPVYGMTKDLIVKIDIINNQNFGDIVSKTYIGERKYSTGNWKEKVFVKGLGGNYMYKTIPSSSSPNLNYSFNIGTSTTFNIIDIYLTDLASEPTNVTCVAQTTNMSGAGSIAQGNDYLIPSMSLTQPWQGTQTFYGANTYTIGENAGSDLELPVIIGDKVSTNTLQRLKKDTNFTYNSSTDTVKVTNLSVSGNVTDGTTTKTMTQVLNGVEPVLIETEQTLTVRGYSVPVLTGEQVSAIYTAKAAGMPVTIVDPTGNYHFDVDQADSMSGIISVDYKFFNTMFLTYTLENNTVSVKGTLIDSLDYLTTAPTEDNTVGLKFVVLASEPATYYTGYYYIITEE